MYSLWRNHKLTPPDYYLLRALVKGSTATLVPYEDKNVRGVTRETVYTSYGERYTPVYMRGLCRRGYLREGNGEFLPTDEAKNLVAEYSFQVYKPEEFSVEYKEPGWQAGRTSTPPRQGGEHAEKL